MSPRFRGPAPYVSLEPDPLQDPTMPLEVRPASLLPGRRPRREHCRALAPRSPVREAETSDPSRWACGPPRRAHLPETGGDLAPKRTPQGWCPINSTSSGEGHPPRFHRGQRSSMTGVCLALKPEF